MKKLRAGIFGLGHLGKIHLKVLKEICNERNDIEIAGIFDSNNESNASISEENNFSVNNSADELIGKIDIAIIVTPTSSHYELAYKTISAGINTFIEKPVTDTTEEANKLLKLAEGKDV
ncbi:MAG: Gfo/Idh/MocA family oxidoreductase, partial [Ignavibacteria bacterium]|nr:Gfo/Idh/MocA family oxidoreductase [Ignavibacteria bacterium]